MGPRGEVCLHKSWRVGGKLLAILFFFWEIYYGRMCSLELELCYQEHRTSEWYSVKVNTTISYC